jgi:hypothetical protein
MPAPTSSFFYEHLFFELIGPVPALAVLGVQSYACARRPPGQTR